MAVAAILATTTTATASIYDDRHTEPQELISSDINQNDKSQEIDEQSTQTAADNRKRKHRQPLSIRRIDEEISTQSNIQESASPLQHTQPQTLIGQSYKIPPSQSNNEKVVVKGTVSTNDERILGKIGNRAGLLAKRRNNNNNNNNSSGNNNNKNRTVGNGKKAGSNQNRNQGTQSSGNNNNNKNGNRTNPNKKQRTQLPGQVRPGRQKKPGFRNRGGKLGLGRRRGPRLFHDTSTHRWGTSGDTRWSGGTRWYSKSSKSKGGKKYSSSWSIDDCWDTSTSWDLPSWPRPGDWERSYSIDWHPPPSWGDDDWKPGWNDDDDWKPGWKPKPPSWSGGWQWVDDWNSNWGGGGGWWGKIEEESLFPTESPELFPTLSPTLAPTLSP